MSDHEDLQEAEGYICVAGGPNIRAGQVAISEVHPDHPYVASERKLADGTPSGDGEHQVFVVKGDAKFGAAWAARTSEVSRFLSRGFLVEVKAPSWLPAAKDGPETESSQRVANLRQVEAEAVGITPSAAAAGAATPEALDALKAQVAQMESALEGQAKTAEEELNAAHEANEAAARERENAARAAAKTQTQTGQTQAKKNG